MTSFGLFNVLNKQTMSTEKKFRNTFKEIQNFADMDDTVANMQAKNRFLHSLTGSYIVEPSSPT